MVVINIHAHACSVIDMGGLAVDGWEPWKYLLFMASMTRCSQIAIGMVMGYFVALLPKSKYVTISLDWE